jgi:hypothetical protein
MTTSELNSKFRDLDNRLRRIVVNRCQEMPTTNVGKIVIFNSEIFFWNGTQYERILTEDGLIDPITVVANYAAFPLPADAVGEFYWAEASQGIPYTPDWFGGTYYGKGLYYSNGLKWEPIPVPFQATQLEVDTGINDNKFVTPLTFTSATKWDTKADITALNDWAFYATNVFYNGVETIIGSGNVLECTYKGNLIYRFISNTNNSEGYPLEDSFYTTFSAGVLSNKITQRNI